MVDVTPAPSAGATASPSASPSADPNNMGGYVNSQVAGGAGAPGGNIYMGFWGPTLGLQTTPNITQLVTGGRSPVHPNAITQPLMTAVNSFYQWTPDQLNQFRNMMGKLNTSYLTAPNTDPSGGQSLLNAWTNLVYSAQQYQQHGQQLSPWDVLQQNIAATDGGRGKGGKTITKTVDQVNLTSKADAHAIFYQAAQQLLGRAPTDSEMAQFTGYLNAQEQANPMHVTKQITYNEQGYPIDTNVTKQSGGISSGAAQMMAAQQAKQNPEYGAYQASTTYMNALKQMLGM